MKNTIIIALILSLSFSIFAGKVDGNSSEYGWQMLKIPVSTASAGLGGNGLNSVKDGLNFTRYPTTGLLTDTRAVTFSQNYWIFDTVLNNIRVTSSNGKKSMSFAMKYLDYGTIEAMDENGDSNGEFNPMDLDFVGNMAFRVHPDHYFGANLHLLYEKIHTESSFGFSTDWGYTYLTPLKDLNLNFNLKNLGATTKMKDENIDLPLVQELSATKSLEFNKIKSEIETKIANIAGDENLKSVTSIQSNLMGLLDLRFAYKINYDDTNISTGIGINVNRFKIDYSYIPYSNELDDFHMIGLSYLF